MYNYINFENKDGSQRPFRKRKKEEDRSGRPTIFLIVFDKLRDIWRIKIYKIILTQLINAKEVLQKYINTPILINPK